VQYVYLDNNATTPCDVAVLDAMLPFFSDRFGNPVSPHAMGREAFSVVAEAREGVAQSLRCSPKELLFTSGATESNNILLLGFSPQNKRRRFVTSAIEHKSIQMPLRHRLNYGIDLKEMSVTTSGIVDLSSADSLIDRDTALVSVQAANNETGVLQPIEDLADMAHSRGALFHCDASQWVGKLPIPQWFDQCDFLSVSGHKFYGPKGAGVLVVRSGTPRRYIAPILFGGGQEDGLRSGTSNVPCIVGLSVACRLAVERVAKDEVDVQEVRNRFEASITVTLPQARINGASAKRLPGSCSLTIPGIPASMLIANLPALCIGEGSACTSGTTGPSHVLLAMGLSRDEADCTVRISFGRQNTMPEAGTAVEMISEAVERLSNQTCVRQHQRRMSPAEQKR